MGKYRTSPYYRKCGNRSCELLLWGLFFFVSPGIGGASPLTTPSDQFFQYFLGQTQNIEKYDVESSYFSLSPIGTNNCTPSALNDFPTDLFTRTERRQGAILLHFIASLYIFFGLLLVCDDYFVPAIESITRELRISTDLAGATFMAISTSAPELFTNVIGTFVTKGDIGVGTIVGSAVFNILAVGSACGLGARLFFHKLHGPDGRKGIHLEWYSLTRDCLFYLCSVGLLLLVLANRRIYWYEALTLILFYSIYILVMCNNALFKSWAESFVGYFSKNKEPRSRKVSLLKTEKSPLIEAPEIKNLYTSGESTSSSSCDSLDDDVLLTKVLLRSESRFQEDKETWSLWSCPKNLTWIGWIGWFVSWPIRFCFFLTIPDCRNPRWRRWYFVTLLITVCWIAGLTYLVSWMMCVIGDTLDVPESVTGLTFLAAGTSIPEVISSIIVTRQGFGSMGLSNSIGSNTFDLLICLGLPWFIESLLLLGTDRPFVEIHSGGLEISVGLLVTSLIIFYIVIACNGFVLDGKVGGVCLLTYLIFITIACLLELNVFFPVNLPTCL